VIEALNEVLINSATTSPRRIESRALHQGAIFPSQVADIQGQVVKRDRRRFTDRPCRTTREFGSNHPSKYGPCRSGWYRFSSPTSARKVGIPFLLTAHHLILASSNAITSPAAHLTGPGITDSTQVTEYAIQVATAALDQLSHPVMNGNHSRPQTGSVAEILRHVPVFRQCALAFLTYFYRNTDPPLRWHSASFHVYITGRSQDLFP
jgi:hypothetical protein